jgi:hypothetical protein
MSHHLDSPIARQDIRLDITDLYVFRGERGTVFVIDVSLDRGRGSEVPDEALGARGGGRRRIGGPSRRSQPTPAGGGRSIASACR